MGACYVGTEHLLLGIIAEGRESDGHILLALGVDIHNARRTVVGVLCG
ncbi:Clp protease N-terminal domain-containing protein [Streptosporangium algeriense]|uniref:Clp protease N-terminal domain-containing protein n=1 Tax=Streptosporangium algeriense TaxID=1682748 RepID=A0ABW3DW83_9ACTN